MSESGGGVERGAGADAVVADDGIAHTGPWGGLRMAERDLRTGGEQLGEGLLPYGIDGDGDSTASQGFDLRLGHGEVEPQAVPVPLCVCRVGPQRREHLAEAVVRVDEDVEAELRQASPG